MGLNCPQCHSKAFKRNGYTRHGKQNHRCLDCGRQFSTDQATTDYNLAETQQMELSPGLVVSSMIESTLLA